MPAEAHDDCQGAGFQLTDSSMTVDRTAQGTSVCHMQATPNIQRVRLLCPVD